jgi:hypothetical protein
VKRTYLAAAILVKCPTFASQDFSTHKARWIGLVHARWPLQGRQDVNGRVPFWRDLRLILACTDYAHALQELIAENQWRPHVALHADEYDPGGPEDGRTFALRLARLEDAVRCDVSRSHGINSSRFHLPMWM